MSVVPEAGWQGQFTSNIDTCAAPGADCVSGRQEEVPRCQVVVEGLIWPLGIPGWGLGASMRNSTWLLCVPASSQWLLS